MGWSGIDSPQARSTDDLVSRTQRSASASAFTRVFDTLWAVHRRARTQNRENNPMQSKMGPARSTRAALRSGHEKKNGSSSRPSLISSRSIFLFEHDLFGKPVPTFPDHALARPTRQSGPRPEIPRGVGIFVETVHATGHGRRVPAWRA